MAMETGIIRQTISSTPGVEVPPMRLGGERRGLPAPREALTPSVPTDGNSDNSLDKHQENEADNRQMPDEPPVDARDYFGGGDDTDPEIGGGQSDQHIGWRYV